MPVTRLFKNIRTNRCNKATERRIRQRDVEILERCGDMEFSLYRGEGGEMVYGVETFKYLGKPLDKNYEYWTAICETSCVR